MSAARPIPPGLIPATKGEVRNPTGVNGITAPLRRLKARSLVYLESPLDAERSEWEKEALRDFPFLSDGGTVWDAVFVRQAERAGGRKADTVAATWVRDTALGKLPQPLVGRGDDPLFPGAPGESLPERVLLLFEKMRAAQTVDVGVVPVQSTGGNGNGGGNGHGPGGKLEP